MKHFETTDLKINKAENGKMYLPKGKYKVKIAVNDKNISAYFESL